MVASVGATLLAAAVLAACGTGQVGDTGTSGAAGNKKLVLIPGVKAEPFYISMQCGAQEEARSRGYELETQPPDRFEAALQTPILTGAIANRPAGILIAPTDDRAMAGPMKQGRDAGVTMVEVDTALQDTSIAVASVSSDNEQGGRKAAETLATLVGDRQGSVLVLNTIAGTSTTDARAKGFEQEIAKHPNLRYLGAEYTNNQPAEAAQKVSATLSANPDLIGVFATNLNTGEGAGTALRNAGRTGSVNLVGFDASPKQVEDLRNGVVQALIAQDPATIGRRGVEQAVNAIEGKPVQRRTQTDLVAITGQDMAANEQYFYRTQC
ncbi:monosaccharide ABC transporter substrate-binding protein, CUT2 family [Goodfellowiella coeruleoviolacea]|uniref:Monosaccharide ABC transporter substrate-binding protein, CUT2 family n=1 Tax=Goodfellowiella coeruleoviolacea TaxID=334858 RepID=A0AAE3KI17_9PSEU|nr:monosaccharide ABC transporter substrate-binding protein, CUT2 family [Goodfellowiella coeruleoviolacea]